MSAGDRFTVSRRAALAGSAAALLAPAARARAQASGDVVRLGVINDQSGIYSDAGGLGAATVARMAAEDMGGTVLGKPIEIVAADHQNKPDVAATVVRQWIDQGGVDAVVDGGSSACGVAIQQIAREKNRIFLISGSGTTELTNTLCSPLGFAWSWDTYALAAGTVNALMKGGLDTWFFIVPDYTFGHVLQAQATQIVEARGGVVLGAVRHPFNTSDFSSYLLQAQASGAKVVGFANSGGDATTSLKQAREFGMMAGPQKLAALMLNITDTHALGLEVAQGLTITTAYYWDRNDASRAFGKRFLDRVKRAPTYLQAGAYSAVGHYLRAVQAAGTDEATAVAAQMRRTRINDPMTENGWIREDGRVMRDMYLVQVKTPAESKYPWDYYKVLDTVPAEQAALPLAQSTCPLLRKPG